MAKFQIYLNEQPLATKRAWNASLRHVEKHVRQYVQELPQGTELQLVRTESIKDGSGLHVQGLREWESSDKQIKLSFYITKE